MNLLVTGATGFLGRSVVTEAIARGHRVRAAVRPASNLDAYDWTRHPDVDLWHIDLRDRRGVHAGIDGADAVIHLAADKFGGFHAQFAANVVATEHLLDAMTDAGIDRMIAVSTFSVYDVLRMRSGATLDENSPLEADPVERDDYARTKLLQEQLITRHATAHDWRLTVVRPGMLYGADNLFNARLGMPLGSGTWIRIGAWARVPLVYVEHCAEAVVMCAENDASIGETLNIVDDDPPRQRTYLRELQARVTPRRRVFPVSWTVARLLARAAWLTNRVCFGGRAKVPGVLIPARLHPRAKPLRFANDRVREILGWSPRYSRREALDRSLRSTPASGATPADRPAVMAGRT